MNRQRVRVNRSYCASERFLCMCCGELCSRGPTIGHRLPGRCIRCQANLVRENVAQFLLGHFFTFHVLGFLTTLGVHEPTPVPLVDRGVLISETGLPRNDDKSFRDVGSLFITAHGPRKRGQDS